MRGALALLVVAGCNQVLGIHDTHKADAAGDQLCDPLPFDPARYFAINSQSLGFSWTAARAACQGYGFDLIVIDANDSGEIVNELTGGTVPFWIGASFDGSQWSAIDTCTPELAWANGQPTPDAVGQCLLQDSSGMMSYLCTNAQAGPGISALCETPRPSPACRAAAMQRTYFVGSTTGVLEGMAEQICGGMGGHVVEIDSSDELSFVTQNYANVADFWLGARLAGGTFTSPTSCPQVFIWAQNNPSPGETCTYYNGGMHTDSCTSAHAVICEAN